MGFCGGLMGALFNASNTMLTKWRMRNVGPRGPKRFIEVIIVVFTISTIHFLLPLLYDGWTTKSEDLSINSRLYWDAGAKSIKSLFHSQMDFDIVQLLVFGTVQYVL